jgi:hypothetical protein
LGVLVFSAKLITSALVFDAPTAASMLTTQGGHRRGHGAKFDCKDPRT